MPADGISLSPKDNIMTANEVFEIAKLFVAHGVTKIRLTGGEPLIRKDAPLILEKLTSLPVELSITTNGIIVDRFITQLKSLNIKHINVSLDSLQEEKFKKITRRDYFKRVYKNIFLLLKEGFYVKINCVLMKSFNEDEIIDFINLAKSHPLHIRFIEFMPFDGNKWNLDRLVSQQDILDSANKAFNKENVIRLQDSPNDTSRNYKIKDYAGTFAIISTVTNPFCDTCNRIRLTANGKLKNCLFSSSESDLLTSFRNGKSIEPIISKALQVKHKARGGMDTLEKFSNPKNYESNRSMIAIGG
jgi:cyclic pyranopterin phosphate synthase